MEQNKAVDSVSSELIVVKQLPEIEERLHSIKEAVDQMVEEASAMVCTEDTVQAIKAKWAKLNQQFSILEYQRKAAKKAVLEPYERFEAVYRECISIGFQKADEALKAKIAEVENEMKRRCEEGLREYFAELCAVHHLDWLTYERAGIKVDMASAKAKTPKKLREQLVTFVVGVAESVDRIGRKAEAFTIQSVNRLRGVYTALQDGTASVEQYFDMSGTAPDQEKPQEALSPAAQQEEQVSLNDV